MQLDKVFTQDVKKQSKVVTGEFIPEFVVKTKVRLPLNGVTIAKGQQLVVSVNRGFDGNRDIGYFFMHSGKRFDIRKKDVEVMERYK